MSNIYYVYEHWRPDTKSCFYVGLGKGYRSGTLRGRNPHHANVFKKLLNIGLSVEVKRIYENLTRAEAVSKEIERISFWRSLGVRLTNMTDGGDGIHNVAASSRERISSALKGNKHSLGVKRTTQERATVSERMKGNKIWLGRPLTEEHRNNLSVAHKGKHFDSPKNKAVICVTDGLTFISAGMAARHYGLHPTQISQVCLHYSGNLLHPHRKSAGGKIFNYIEEAA